MTILLYHRNLSLTSGTGQLVHMQAQGLRARGERPLLACQRRGLKFFLRTGLPVRTMSGDRVRAMIRRRSCMLVDHGMIVPEADIVFVHNVVTEANRHLDRDELRADVAHEADFFANLQSDSQLIANSQLTRNALVRCFGLAPDRISVTYPGFRSARFTYTHTPQLRAKARRMLGVSDQTPLIGLVTSGDFHKRGLDLFLDAAARIAAARNDARFLVVGSRRLPDYAATHELVTGNKLMYRPKSHRPHLWMAALDIFLYPARYEEFGMVVSEAQASGIVVVTSRRTGAAECLPDIYQPWLADTPVPDQLAENVLKLLENPALRQRLVEAGLGAVAAYDQHHYASSTVNAILDQKRKLK